jgi:hypothetical protein
MCVSKCLHMSIHVYTCVHASIHACLYVCVYIYVAMYMCVCARTCKCILVHACFPFVTKEDLGALLREAPAFIRHAIANPTLPAVVVRDEVIMQKGSEGKKVAALKRIKRRRRADAVRNPKGGRVSGVADKELRFVWMPLRCCPPCGASYAHALHGQRGGANNYCTRCHGGAGNSAVMLH